MFEELRARQTRKFGRQPRRLTIELLQLSLLATLQQTRLTRRTASSAAVPALTSPRSIRLIAEIPLIEREGEG